MPLQRRIGAALLLGPGLSLGCFDVGSLALPWVAETTTSPDGGGPVELVATSNVAMRGLAFVPPAIQIAIGDTVTWTNEDPVRHTVTEGWPTQATHVFDSARLSTAETFSFTFAAPGAFYYYCRTHSMRMVGALVQVGPMATDAPTDAGADGDAP